MDAIRLIEEGERLKVDVDPREIELAFARLWDSARDDPDAPLATRASATNVVAATPETFAGDTESLLSEVTARLPGRVILLVLGEADDAPSMTAWLSALCRLGGSGSEHVCCELITIRAAGPAIEELPRAVTPLLLGDLPATLWWRDDPASRGALMRELAGVCGRVLLDLGRGSREGMAALAPVRDLSIEGVHVGDVLWTRLAPWRRAFARFFDPAASRETLDHIRAVRFRVCSRRGAVSAALLAAWLCERLRWTLRVAEGQRAEFGDAAGNAVSWTVDAGEAQEDCMHGIEAWTVEAADAEGTTVGYSLRSKDDAGHVEAAFTAEGACPLPSILEVEDPGEIAAVTTGLEQMGPDTRLIRAAQTAAQSANPKSS